VCGRIALYDEPGQVARLLDVGLDPELAEEWRPRWNLGPTTQIFGVAQSMDGLRTMSAYRWGLVPSWAKDPAAIKSTFNARAETVATKPMYRKAFQSQRILVPVQLFYEWKAGTPKQPYAFKRADGEPVVFAGLRERWKDAEGAELRTATIITTEAGPDMPIHTRQPVVLERSSWDKWLDRDVTGGDTLLSLLRPTVEGTLVHFPVNPDIGNTRNEGPQLLDPVIDIG
jgi:putative SOS response-associated peptidase YedK